MHWAYELAMKTIERNPNKKEYVCASGISPSGSVHIGNYREFVTTYFVAKALKSLGKNVRMLFSWDDFDRLRKLPKNIGGLDESMIGKPYSFVPDPNGKFNSYAEYFEKEFESALKDLHMNEVKVDFIYQTKEYMSGRYSKQIIQALKKRKEIYDILMQFKTQEATDEDRENYYPINIYCDCCNKDTTKINSISKDCKTVTYTCACGNTKTINIEDYTKIKLVWKVDWPMRWMMEGVDFEPGGIDHSAAGGSYEVSTVIADKIFNIKAPLYQGYGWLGIRGLGDMHSSSGNNITPGALLNIYEPEIIRWLFAKYYPTNAFDFDFGETIIRHYSEFDKAKLAYINGEIDEKDKAVFDLCLFDSKSSKFSKTPFGTLASIAPISEFNPIFVKKLLNKVNVEFTEDSIDRLNKTKYWLENYMSEKLYKLRKVPNLEYMANMSERELASTQRLYEYLNSAEEKTESDIQQKLYQIINDPNLSKKENVAIQKQYFKNFYNLLFGTDSGPRLYLFLAAVDKAQYIELLKTQNN
ncbi:MAG: lysine--tRNA ligase [Clostridia bacterium]|nr:lysine--tRNA ligase [Clostridia bacterium]